GILQLNPDKSSGSYYGIKIQCSGDAFETTVSRVGTIEGKVPGSGTTSGTLPGNSAGTDPEEIGIINEDGDRGIGGYPPGSAPTEYLQGFVSLHNYYRKQHKADPFIWSSDLRKSAQWWANNCPQPSDNNPHEDADRKGLGENIYYTSDTSFKPGAKQAVDKWYGERTIYERFSRNYSINYPLDAAQFNADNASSSTRYSHFTQIVWTDTKQIGCALSFCAGYANQYVIVCRYSPRGNIYGSFQAKVKKP
ncbi:MAG: hypothetical protein HQK54_09885, partial [Oligoflexales bacterium]|nr:hypothetical protein [Oligoflexales bacterium]